MNLNQLIKVILKQNIHQIQINNFKNKNAKKNLFNIILINIYK